jgi:translation initiation factor IF-3
LRLCGRSSISKQRVNREIRAREVRVIAEDNEQLGIMPIREALILAEDRDLDLVEVAPNVDPPVCKLMDFGKLKYKQKKRQKESHRSQQLKEITVSLKISDHDLQTKIKHMQKFLGQGHKVKLNVHMRGREKEYASTLGKAMLDKVGVALADISQIESMGTKLVGNRIHMILSSGKTGDVKHAKDENTQSDSQTHQGDRQRTPDA